MELTPAENPTPEPVQPAGAKPFNYCLWAKLIVAIPALPLMAVIGGALFATPVLQVIGAGAGVGLAIYAAIQIDRMPCFAGKVVKKA